MHLLKQGKAKQETNKERQNIGIKIYMYNFEFAKYTCTSQQILFKIELLLNLIIVFKTFDIRLYVAVNITVSGNDSFM